MTDPKERIAGITFTGELVVNVSGYMPGEIQDWPSNIQDAIYAAKERYTTAMRAKYQVSNLQYDVVRSQCDFDVDTGFYVLVYIKGRMILQ